VSAREEVLGRVRAALAAAPPAPVTVPRGYRHAGTQQQAGDDALVERLVDRLLDYKAVVHRCGEQELPETLVRVLAERGSTSVAVPAGVPGAWTDAFQAADALLVRRDDPPLGVDELDGTDSVVTACAVAVADTGTIVLDAGPDQGRRALTLVPDHHVCVVRREQVVALVPDAVARLGADRPLTWISGPSATSDIELERVEGVHGPRTLEVVLVG
jgi:L-lactate dehydrogenase complex protein LldG